MSAKRGCLLRGLKGLCYFVLALAVLHAGLTLWAGRKLERELEALRKAGEPVTAADLAGPEISPERNAFTYLSEAGRFMMSVPDRERLLKTYQTALEPGQPDWGAVEQALERFAPAERLIRRALECPDARMVDWKRADVLTLTLPDLSTTRELARLLGARSALAAQRGDTAGAVRYATEILRLSGCLRNEPMMIAQLVRYAIIAIGTQRMDVALSSPRGLSIEQARDAFNVVSRIELSDSMEMALRGERVLIFTAMTEARRGPHGVGLLMGADPGVPPRETTGVRRVMDRVLGYVLAPAIYLDQLTYIDLAKRQMEALRAPASERPKLLSEADESLRSTPRYAIFTRLIAPVFGRSMNQCLAAEANIEACKAMLAIAAYRGRTGTYPATLKEACALLGRPVPRDPFTGSELRYRREGSSYLLYSVGEDLKDDGGAPQVKRSVGVREGDLIWGGGRSAARRQ